MAMLRPGDWKGIDPRTMDPESARRLASGFWKHEHSFDSDISTWVCDKRKLHEEVQKICMDNWSFKQFQRDPIRFLDARYGEGTGEAYRHASQDRVAMRFNPFSERQMLGMDLARGKDMALTTFANSGGTFTNASTITSSSTDTWIMEHEREDRVYQHQQRAKKKRLQEKETHHWKPETLVRNMPFVHGGDSLLATLQRDFDHWAGSQMKLVEGI